MDGYGSKIRKVSRFRPRVSSELQKDYINLVSQKSQWEYCSNLQPVFMFCSNAESAYPRQSCKTYFLVPIIPHVFSLVVETGIERIANQYFFKFNI